MSNFKNAEARDIQQAFDMIVAKLKSDGMDVAVDAKATEMIVEVLTTGGYARPKAAEAFTKSHVASKARGNAQETDPATATKLAHEIFAAATGAAAPVSDTAAAPEAAASEAPAQEPVTADVAEPVTQSLVPDNVEKLAKAHDSFKGGINAAISNASGGKVKNIDAFVRAFAEADAYVSKARNALVASKAKLAALEAGDMDAAGSVTVPQIDGFTASGLSALKIEGQEVLMLNGLMHAATQDPAFTFEALLKSLKSVETAAAKAHKAYRDEAIKIRKASPKQTMKGDVTDGLPTFDIVMKMASEIFKERSFGVNADLLEFEVPTIEWHGETPACVPAIDNTFRFKGEIVANALDAISDNVRPWMLGESGCGKSEFWEQIAARLNMPFTRINLDAGITRSDLIGRTVLKPNANGTSTITEFIDGILPSAMKLPGIVMFDEFDCGDPEIMPVLQPVLEGRSLVILEDGGRVVKPNPMCRIVVTANTNGQGSENGSYNNVFEQSAATRNRYTKWIRMPYLPESEEIKVVMERNPAVDPDFVAKMVQFANKARTGYSRGESGHIVSTRQVLEASRMYGKFLPLLKDPTTTREWVLQTVIYIAADDKSADVLKAVAGQIWI